MAFSIVRLMLIASSVLLGMASAGRMGERSRRRGFSEATLKDMQARRSIETTNTTTFRFLNNATKGQSKP
jgi:hypothetical protein